MAPSTVADLRLRNQRIAQSTFGKPEQVVAWLGGLQGQDYAGAKWSIGLRLPGSTDATIEQAIAQRTLVRTWPMRGTLHVVAAADIHWMLALTAPRNLAASARRQQQLGLDDAVLGRCKALFAKALQGDKQLARDALYRLLERAGISVAGQRGYHILWRLALDGLICFGPMQGKQQTFALLDDWVPKTGKLARDEALAELAKRYFTSRGPATFQDYLWWSGLAAADARAGLEMVKPQLASASIRGQDYWLPQSLPHAQGKARAAHALPGFDEYLLGYKNRGAVLDAAHAGKVCPGGNGMFASTMLIQGRIVGTWRRTLKKNAVAIVASPFSALNKTQAALFADAARRYADFLGLPARVAMTDSE